MKIPNRVRYFNKRFLNHLTARIARLGWGPFAIISHTGRRSGRPYETPLWAFPTPAGFVIALTYGPQVDWYRNIRAAGGCRVLYHRREYAIGRVEPANARAALPLFPQPIRSVLGWIGMRDFVKLEGKAL